jgi:hypothetical protein
VTIRTNSNMKLQPGHVHNETKNVKKRPGKRLIGDRKNTRKITVKGLFLVQQPLASQGLLIHEVSRSHSMTHYSR